MEEFKEGSRADPRIVQVKKKKSWHKTKTDDDTKNQRWDQKPMMTPKTNDDTKTDDDTGESK